MQKTIQFKTILTSLILAVSILFKLFSPINFQNQLLILVIALIFTGIPHGAIDHLVEEKNANFQKKKFSLVGFITRYVATILIYAISWFFLPEMSLIFFLGISAWHFGETDIPLNRGNIYSSGIMRFIWGNVVLAFLLLNNGSEVKSILTTIIPPQSWTLSAFSNLCEHKNIALGILFLSFSILFIISQKPKSLYNWYFILLPLLVLIIVSKLPIILGFTLYFAFWHSIIAFKTISSYILPHLNFKEAFLKTWIKTLPFTFLAFFFLILSYIFWQSKFFQSDPTMLIFIFISTITLPHLLVMHTMYSGEVS